MDNWNFICGDVLYDTLKLRLGGSKVQTVVFVRAQTAADLLTLVSYYYVTGLFHAVRTP